MKNLGTYALSCLIHKCTYECKECAALCYDKSAKNKNGDDDGYGLCLRCGGKNVLNKPKYIRNMELARLRARSN